MEQKKQVSEARNLIMQAIEQAENLYGVRVIRVNAKRHEITGDIEVVRLIYETKITTNELHELKERDPPCECSTRNVFRRSNNIINHLIPT